MYAGRDDLPVTEEELVQFVLAGKKFYEFDNVNDVFYHYSTVNIHVAKNLHLIKYAECVDYQSIMIKMRGTNERVRLNRYDQADRYLFKEVCMHIFKE